MSSDPAYDTSQKIALAVEGAIKEHLPPGTRALVVFAVPTPRPMHYLFCSDIDQPEDWVTRLHFIFEQFDNQLLAAADDKVS